MSNTATARHVEELLEKAMKKLGISRQTDLCRFIPGPNGGYIHHFTLKKMQNEDPEMLSKLIDEHILHHDNPSRLTPKKRATRGSRKRRDQVLFTKQDIERILKMAKMAGDDEMVRKVIAQRQDIKALKRELIASIRQSRVEPHLWQTYVETIQNQQSQQHQTQLQAATAG